MNPSVLIPGRPISVGGTVERALARILDRAHDLDLEARRHAQWPSTWAAIAGAGNGLRHAAALLADVDSHQVDVLYTARFGALPREVQGRPVGNAQGRHTPSTHPTLLEEHPHD